MVYNLHYLLKAKAESLLLLQLQSGEHAKLAFPHLQFVQLPLQEHLISSL